MEGKNDLPVTRFRDTIEVIGAIKPNLETRPKEYPQ